MSGAIVFIPLTQGKVAVIDFADFESVRGIKWHAHRVGRRIYAGTKVGPPGKKTVCHLHRFLMPGFPEVDHQNGDGLNCIRGNLRAASHAQNQQGFQLKRPGCSSVFRGVYWKKQDQKWRALIRPAGKSIHLGCFRNEVDAARAYDKAAREHFGEFASPNFKT